MSRITTVSVLLLVCGIMGRTELTADDLELPDLPVGLTSFGAAVSGGYLYVYGGNMGDAHTYSRDSQNNIFRRVHLKSKSEWEELGEVPRRQGLALVAHGGKIYRIGGFEADNEKDEEPSLASTDDFACYDTATGQWSDLPHLPESRSSFDAVVAGDAIYVVGGWEMKPGEESKWHSTAWRFDLSADDAEWEPLPEPEFHRRAIAIAERNGKVVVIGGMAEQGGPSGAVSIFDPSTGKWSDGPELPDEQMKGFGASAFKIGDRICASTASGAVLQLGDDGKSWEKIHEIKTGRFFHRLVALSDHQLAIIGGTSMDRSDPGKKTATLVIDIKDSGK